MKKSASKHKHRYAAPVFEGLEPRILLSADLPGLDVLAHDTYVETDDIISGILADAQVEAARINSQLTQADDTGSHDSTEESDTLLAATPNDQKAVSYEVVFIDSTVPDYELLLNDLQLQTIENRIIDVIILDPNRDGVEQISEALNDKQNIDALHLISHGSAGEIVLGNSKINNETLLLNNTTISNWGAALTEEADFLIYGCDLAANEAGEALVDTLAELTGADVAASDDLTGHKSLGGDWDLEYKQGEIETTVVISEESQRNWNEVLSVAVDTTSTGASTGGNITISHTTSGSNTLMMVGVSMNLGGASNVSSITYNGDNMSLVGTQSNGDAVVEIWSLLNPDLGTHNVDIVFSASTDGNTAAVMTFSGVDQSSPLGTFSSNSGGGSSGSVSMSSTSDDLVFGMISVDDPSNYDLVPGGSQTENWDAYGYKINSGGGTKSGAASVDMSWSWSGSDAWSAAGVSINALINNAPEATNLSAAESYTEDTALNLTDIVITDTDSENITATLTLSNIAAGSLNTANSGAVTSTYNAGTGEWRASGVAADVNALLAGISFTPTSNFNADFTIATSVSDGIASAITGTKTMTGVAETDAPTAVNDTLLDGLEDSTSAILNASILSNDSDLDGDAISITAINVTALTGGVQSINVTNGTVNIDASDNITFTADANYSGAVSFEYTISDTSLTDTATVNGTISAVNDAPVRTAGTISNLSVNEDSAMTTLGLAGVTYATGGGTDESSQTLTYEVTTIPDPNTVGKIYLANGTTQVSAGFYSLTDIQGMQFIPEPDYNGGPSFFTYRVLDDGGTVNGGSNLLTESIQLDVTAINDAASIAGVDSGSVQEDVSVVADKISTSGLLTITEVDSGEATFVAATINGSYGDLGLQTDGNWIYSADNSQPNIQQLDVGESITDTLTVSAFDGTTHDIVITINGSDDAAVIGGTTTGSVTDDESLTSSGTLTISDTDSSDTPAFADIASTAGDNSYGSFVMSGQSWTYTLDGSNTAVQALDVGETLTDTHTFTATDGSTQQITVTINGTEDLPTVVNNIANQTAVEEALFNFTFASNVFADIDTSDTLSYSATLDDDSSLPSWLSFNNITRSFSGTPTNDDVGYLLIKVIANDGSGTVADTFTLTIKNTNDAPVIGGDTSAALTEDVDTDADTLLEISGTLTIADPDAGESSFLAGTIGGVFGNLDIDTAGNWSYSADNTQAVIQQLDIGESINDILNVTTADGTAQTITITINGAEDAAVITAISNGSVNEDGTLTDSGTLSITDVDTSDNPVSFENKPTVIGDNGYGDFTLTDGTWVYTLNNTHTSIQALDSGESLTDTHTFTATDGSSSEVTITINGTEDDAVITGTAVGTVSEDGTLTAGAALAISDVDTSDNPVSFANVAPIIGNNGYGVFSMSASSWSYTLDNNHSAVQALDAGETLTDSHTFTASGGATQIVTITINGMEDAPTLVNSIADQTAAEDAPFSFTFASNVFVDIDTSDTLSYSATLADDSPLPGWLSFDGSTRAFSGTPSNADLGSLTIKVTADDSSSTVTDSFTLTINNTGDAPVIGGDVSAALTEDVDPDADTLLEISGTLTIADPDAGESSFLAGTIGGVFGNLIIDTAGNWSYSADNTQAVIQQLDIGESINDVLTVTTADGTAQTITITINGAEDAAVISAVSNGSVAEDGTLTASGTFSITDVDASDNPVNFANESTVSGDNGYGDFTLTDGTWTYTLNNAHTSVQALDSGESLTDTHTFTASDSSNSEVTITINGAEDNAVITGTTSGAVSEDDILTTGAALAITDIDTSDNPVSFPDEAAVIGNNGYGDFSMSAGSWSYTLDNNNTSIQALDAGETLTDSHIFSTSSGGTQLVTVTINGTEDSLILENPIPNRATVQGSSFNFTFGANTFTDVDSSDTLLYSATLADDSPLPAWLNFDAATRTFSGTSSNSDIGTVSIKVTADDGTTTLTDTFNLTVKTTSTPPAITGNFTGSVTEDIDPDANTLLETSGTLTITDPDAAESGFIASTISGNYGNLNIDTDGNWSYAADNTQQLIQQLDSGVSVNDVLRVNTADGTSRNITITINGAEDAAIIIADTAGTVAEDGTLSVNGSLSITDIDTADNPISFTDEASTPGDNGYGDFVLSGGIWTYTLNNAHASIQALDSGEYLTDTYSFSASDGTIREVTITINGAEDAAVITGTTTGTVTEDTDLTVSGSLAITDIDTQDNPVSFPNESSTAGNNGFGNFVLSSGTWSYTLNTGLTAIQSLDIGQTLSDSHTFTASDGSTQVVNITINGAEDLPTLEIAISDQTAAEDSPFSFTLASSVFADIDSTDILSYSASLADNSPLPTWLNFNSVSRTFSGTPANEDVGILNIKVTADDGSGSASDTFSLRVNNTDDAPIIAGDTSGTLTEDFDPDADSLLETDGVLTINDADVGESSFLAGTVGGVYGDLTIDTAGNWSYTASNNLAVIQRLDSGESISDVLTVTTLDGTTQTVTITINGTEDDPVISTTNASVREDATLTASATLTITDMDTADNPVSFPDEVAIAGDNGLGEFELTAGTWTYILNNSHASVQALDNAESLTDTHTFYASDGSSQIVTITINGSEDDPVISGTTTGAVSEDTTLTTNGVLTITDIDSNDNPVSFPNEGEVAGDNGFGTFILSGSSWSYTLNNAHTSVQALAVGETLTDTHTFYASSGTPQLVTITISGTEDLPTVANPITDQTAAEDAPFNYTFASIVFADIDKSDTLSYSATLADDNPLPAWLNFDTATRSFSGTPANADVGILSIKVIANDGYGTVFDTFQLTINNTDDVPVIGGDLAATLNEDLDPDADSLLEISGTLTIADPDVGESSFLAGTIGGVYGDLIIDSAGNWSYSASNNQLIIQQLDVGESIDDLLTVTTADGTSQIVTISITGTEDLPTLENEISDQAAIEDSTFSFTFASNVFADMDSSDTLSYSATLVDGNPLPDWLNFDDTSRTFSGLPLNEHVGILNIKVSATDGSGTVFDTFELTVNNTDDVPVIGGDSAATLSEDLDPDADTLLETSGTLTIADPDVGESSFIAGSVGGTYGNLSIDSAGNWSYSASNSQLSIQQLDVGESTSDVLTVTTADGTSHSITITIHGTEDDPVITATTTGAVTEDVTLTASGTLAISDVDTSDNPVSFPDVAVTSGDNSYGDFSLSSGTWTYTLNNTLAGIQQLDVGQTLTDTHTFSTSEGNTRTVTITINGSEDDPVITGEVTGGVTEDGTLSATGTLAITDTDSNDNPIYFPDEGIVSGDNGFGSFILSGSTWTYTLNNEHASVQALHTASTLSDTHAFVASDGSTQVVTITINGEEDAPTLGSSTLASVAEDTVSPVGQTVSAIFSGQFADIDAGSSLGGIAVVSNSADAVTQGSWQYSTNAGADWFAIGTVADDTTALALSESALMRFLPVADYHGTPQALTVRGLDNSYAGSFSTTAGSEMRVNINTTSYGGTTAIAATPADLSTSITSVADTPSVTNASTDEDIQSTTGLVITANSVDGADVTHYKITGITDGTLYKNDGTTQITNGMFITITEGNAGLKFTPTRDFNGTGTYNVQASTSNTDSGLGESAAVATVTVAPINDAPTAADDHFVLDFDGIDDFITIADSTSLTMSNTMTMEAWITADASDNAGSMIINKEGEYEVALLADGSLNWAFANTDPGWAWHDTGYKVTNGDRTHIAISYDSGSNTIITYVNGVLIETYTAADIGPISDAHGTFDELRIGGRSNNPADQYFDGRIEDVRIWDTARNQSEISANLNTILTGAESGLAGYWRFNEGSGNTANDLTANANNGTLTDGSATGSPVWTGYATDQNTSISIPAASGIISNDSDIDGDTLTVTHINGSIANVGTEILLTSGALLSVDDQGAFVYNPNGALDYLDVGEEFQDSFTYQIGDGNLGTDTATATITIYGTEDAPTISNTVIDQVANEDSAFSFTFAANTFNDVDTSDTLTYTAILADDSVLPLWLNFDNSTRTFSGTPNNADVGVLNIKLIADDGTSTVTETFTLTVSNENDAPVLNTNSLTISEGGGLYLTSSQLDASDVDNPASAITFTISNAVASEFINNNNGLAVTSFTQADIDAGYIYFSHDGGEVAPSYDVSIYDGAITVGPSVASITFTNVNDAPQGTDNTVTAIEDTNYIFTIADFGFSDIDSDNLDRVWFTTVPASGTLNYNGTPFTAGNDIVAQDIIDGRLTYSPTTNTNGNGTASFTFQVKDDGSVANGGVNLDSTPNTMTIDITPVNDTGSFGGNLTATTNEDTATTGFVTFSDSSDGFNSANFTINSAATHGVAAINAAGHWTYTPTENYHGSDAFQIQVTDDDGYVEMQVININVDPINDTTVISGQIGFSGNEGDTVIGTMNATDADAMTDGTYFTVSAQATNGSAAIDAETGAWSFIPTDSNWFGSDSFTVMVSDDLGGTTTQVINITLASVNDTPFIGGTSLGTVIEDVDPDVDSLLETTGKLTISDPDSGESSFIAETINGNYGALSINNSGVWHYAADNTNPSIQALNSNDSLTEIITVTTFDGSTQNINITINGANDASVVITSVIPEPVAELAVPVKLLDKEPDNSESTKTENDSSLNNRSITNTDTDDISDEATDVIQDVTSTLPPPLQANEVFLSVISDRPTTIQMIDQTKPTVEITQTFLQELASFWKDDGLSLKQPDETVRNSPEFLSDVNKMLQDLDKSADTEKKEMELSAEAVAGVSITLTAGIVSWALRAGPLLASFLAAMPAWRHLDPLPILAANENTRRTSLIDDENDPDGIQDKHTEVKIGELFDR